MTKKYIMSSLNTYILLFNIILFLISIHSINLFIFQKDIIIETTLVLILLISIISYFNKKHIIYNIGVFITILTNVILISNIYNINNNYEVLNNLITNKYEYKDYSIYIQKKNPIYNNISNLKNKKIGILSSNYENTCQMVTKTIPINCVKYNNINELEESLQNGKIQAFIIETSKYNNLNSNQEIKYQTRKVYNIKIKDSKN